MWCCGCIKPVLASPTDASHRWQRLSKQQQEDLAPATVHDVALLQEHEKQNLLRNTRQALGPSGQEGRDYQVRDLYLLHENEGTPQSAPIAPYGVQFDSQVYASIALPEQGGQLRLEITANPATLSKQQHGAIQLRWFGVGLFQKSSSELAWQGTPLQHRMQVKGGLLELQGPSDLVVRAFLIACWQRARRRARNHPGRAIRTGFQHQCQPALNFCAE